MVSVAALSQVTLISAKSDIGTCELDGTRLHNLLAHGQLTYPQHKLTQIQTQHTHAARPRPDTTRPNTPRPILPRPSTPRPNAPIWVSKLSKPAWWVCGGCRLFLAYLGMYRSSLQFCGCEYPMSSLFGRRCQTEPHSWDNARTSRPHHAVELRHRVRISFIVAAKSCFSTTTTWSGGLVV